MTSSQIEIFATQLRQRRANYETLEATAAACRREMEGMFGTFGPEMIADQEAAIELVRAEIQDVEVLRRHSIVDMPEDWYRGPGENSHHWGALHEYLKTKGWNPETIDSLDRASTEVVSLLGNPAKDKFACRGLVVGYVQSGKTANMTAVMAKSVDAGYNMIIVLGGVTNKLRKQTQDRFEKDVLRHRDLWQLYTTSAPDGDFVQPANGGFVLPAEGHAQLIVMKKEGSRLKQLRRTISRTPAVVLRGLRVLLIDDECDQASVNSARGEYDMTRINAEIRKVLAALPAISYVGYTATPFANVFINPYPDGLDQNLDDLYPRDFITALERPIGYFGAREVFGGDSAERDGDDLDMIRILGKDEPDLLRPTSPRAKEDFRPAMTESLEEAILWFIASCSIRRSRGQDREHMSMLVHSSPYVRQHEYMSSLIRNWVEQRRSDLIAGTGEVTKRFRDVFERERERTAPAGHGRIPEDFETIMAHVPAVLAALSYPVENGETEDELRLDYTGDPVTCIVVGGTVLARGLTLEGLCVSFFLRTSKQYDTLLQMGRWFGYRRGYEDLPRLWTTEDLASKFRSLATIEEEIREDIAVYRENKLTPRDFAVKVRAIPGMAITAATKMKHAFRTSMSFSGKHVQTIRFDHRDGEVVGGNWHAASRLVDTMLATITPETKKQGLLFRKVPFATVRRFLADTEISEEHMDLKKSHLIGYLDEEGNALGEWDVAIIQTASGMKSAKPLGGLGHVDTMRRSRLREASPRYADIKALMSKADILIDAEREPEGEGDWTSYKDCRPEIPLLLLYLIDAQSAPMVRKSHADKPSSRVALDAIADLVGFGIVFPGAKDHSGGYFSVDIEPPALEETEEGEDQIEEVEGGQD
ncbi:Z1 domain-containing protein [Paenirhodobacter enshiensis]|uniref:Endonuclease n=1 Tax=Paenirhodobacter enshiensis TaxID=1105367 RepID=A0A086Y1G4_9RHOB|nr:Z1 domain-containing protein [Paenirhodobacter enshiensis]KFI28114.1 endonuclease [Paenirhodobacter enshiensis]